MSINHKESVRCPGCSQMQDVTVWSSITVSDSPDLKADLLAGKINMLNCASCGARALLPVPLLYHDEEKKLMISFVPCNDPKQKTELLLEMQNNYRKDPELQKLTDYNLRLVTEYNALLEKILIFDQGMNDKTVELIKIMILMQEPEKMDHRTAMFGKADGKEIEFFVQDHKDGMCYTSRVPKTTYEVLWDELRKSGVKNKSFQWEEIDADYGAALLRGLNT